MALLIVGLGNPGKQYEKTRHNVGFRLIDRIATSLHITLRKPVFKRFMMGKGFIKGQKLVLVKPLTFMNNSGVVFRDILKKSGVSLEDAVVVCDNLDLPVGSCRLKLKGSSGGHNGLKSIIRYLGTENFMRLYIGIGRPERKEDVVSYVLGMPPSDEAIKIEECLDRAADGVLLLLDNERQKVMNVLNRRE